MTNSISEIDDLDLIFIIGSNTSEAHPVIAARMRRARQKGAKIIVAEPRAIDMSEHAEVFLQIRPGTNIALLNGMMKTILDEGLANQAFIAERTENIDALKEQLAGWSAEQAADICGIEAEKIRDAARLYAKANRAGIFYAMGITQHTTGTDSVMALSNLALLCGHVGHKYSGINPLRGQNNVQGACDMGCLPGDFTGYQKVADTAVRQKFAKGWGVASLPDTPGLTSMEMMDAACRKELSFLYIVGENPLVSDPDTAHTQHALESLDFLVVQDIFLTETATLADVVLPAASFAEKDGTFTNTERRVQRVRKAIEPIGQAKTDLEIFLELMDAFGYCNVARTPAEVMDEIAYLTPSYGGISYERLEEDGLQWPCLDRQHPGTPYLHATYFSRGKGLFQAVDYQPSAELPDAEYPYILTTGRILYHYHTRTMTGEVAGLNQLAGDSFVEIHPEIAKKLGIGDGEMVRVSSRRGAVVTKAKVTGRIRKDVLFMPFHYVEGNANDVTNTALDPKAKIPELKVCAVALTKV